MGWVLAAAIALIVVLLIKIYLLKKSAREIGDKFADILKTDTNTLVDISSRDKDMCELADSINKQLKILRKEHLQYHISSGQYRAEKCNNEYIPRPAHTADSYRRQSLYDWENRQSV